MSSDEMAWKFGGPKFLFVLLMVLVAGICRAQTPLPELPAKVSLRGVARERAMDAWVKQRITTLNRGSKLAATATKGVVEYQITGKGPVVISMHGAPGGYEQSSEIAAHLVARGFTVIGISRPGYLRTPLTLANTSAEDQADMVIELMDVLKIPKAAVLGFSAGTLPAFQAGYRHPDRIWAVVLECTGAQPGDAPEYDLLRLILGLNLVSDELPWLLYLSAQSYISQTAALLSQDTFLTGAPLQARIKYVRGTPAQYLFMRNFFYSLTPFSIRREGFLNDISTNYAIDPWNTWLAQGLPQNLRVPCLFIEATDDSNGNYPENQRIQSLTPGSQLISVAGSGHFIWLGSDTARWQKELAAYLKSKAP